RAVEIANAAAGTGLNAAVLLADICIAYSKRGRYEEALKLGERAVEILLHLPWEDVPYGREGLTAIALNNLACAYEDCCQYDRAAQLYERALKLKMQSLPACSKSIGIAHTNMANILNVQERYDEAIPEAQAAIEILAAAGDKDTVNWSEALRALGDAQR